MHVCLPEMQALRFAEFESIDCCQSTGWKQPEHIYIVRYLSSVSLDKYRKKLKLNRAYSKHICLLIAFRVLPAGRL